MMRASQKTHKPVAASIPADSNLPWIDSTHYHTDETQKEREMEALNRITQQPDVMGGKACIRGMRVTVALILGQIGAGHSVDELLADHPYLEREDVMQAIRYPAWRAEEREVTLVTA